MNVWLVTVGEPLPIDGKNERLHRAGILAEYLIKNNHSVVWWTSTFNHFTKKQRYNENKDIAISENYLIKMLYGMSYDRNISLKRIINHYQVASQFKNSAEKEIKPDIIITSMPTIELSLEAAKFGKKHNIPVIIDIRDLWPEIFIEILPKILRPLGKIALYPMYKNLRKACKDAFAITGNSPYFVQWGLNYAERKQNKNLDIFFPFGYIEQNYSNELLEEANNFWLKFGISKDDFIVCFFGSIGGQSNFQIVLESAKKLKNIKFVLCGVGDDLDYYKNNTKLPNVIFTGWVNKVQIHSLMKIAKIGLDPHIANLNYINNLTNKPVEYMSAGLIILTSLKGGYLEEIISKNNCGFIYNDSNELCNILNDLYNNPNQIQIMRENSLNLFKRQYRADFVYNEMVKHLEKIANR